MFGTLRPPQLADQDREVYRAHYCAGCHALREFGGRPLSLLTTYDQTFLLMVLSALRPSASASAEESDDARCTALPFRWVTVQQFPSDVRERVAAVAVLLADAKLADEVDDGRGRLGGIGRRLLIRAVQRARSIVRADGFPAVIDELPSIQLKVERSTGRFGTARLDELIEPTRRVLSEVFAYAAQLAGASDFTPALRRVGESLAEAIYLFDAVEDYERDRKKRRFNALADAWPTPTKDDWPRELIAGRIHGAIQRARAELRELPLADRLGPLDRTLAAFQHRSVREVCDSTTHPMELPPELLAQAGFCDGLDCCVCGEGAGCCGESAGCCAAGEAEGAGYACCMCCDCGSDACCLSATSRKKRAERKKKRAQQDQRPDDERGDNRR